MTLGIKSQIRTQQCKERAKPFSCDCPGMRWPGWHFTPERDPVLSRQEHSIHQEEGH